jgi:4-amino-4-deoxy-L-arabinose transferase-like glycosyltransferase
MQPLNRSTFPSETGMAPALNPATSANSARFRIRQIAIAALIFCAAIVVFASSLNARYFEDEYAYVTQSYYADLFFTGQFHHKLWLDLPALDLQPLPKYLIGLAFRLTHLPMPGPANAWKWYENYSTFGRHATLLMARLTIIPLGAFGCLALFWCGAMVKDARTGAVAALFLMFDALYSQQAHRAMADVPCEAFMVASLATALWLWKRIWTRGPGVDALAIAVLAGVLSGMALLCKLNGFVGLAIVASWCGIGWAAPSLSIRRKAAMAGTTIVTIVTALCAVVALDPYYTAKPEGKLPEPLRALRSKGIWERFRHQVNKRLEISNEQKKNFPDDALFDVPEKARVILMQGFGRFSPFGPRNADSTVRYDFTQDWGVFLWLPLVLVGFRESLRLGCAQVRCAAPSTGLALLSWAICAWFVVTLYLPMAWDRYQLPIQSGNALLAAVGITSLWDRLSAAARSWIQVAKD